MPERKKITILNFNLADNSLGRAYLIAKMLSSDFNVKIAGPAIKGPVWAPLRNSDIEIEVMEYSKFPMLLFKLPAILKRIDGDIIYAIKPRFTSFGAGLLKKFISKKPLILDIDDWEVGFYLRADLTGKISRLIHIFNPNGFFWTWILQFFIRYADKQTTVSTFLQKKYGGIIIPHAKDLGLYNPADFNMEEIKKEHGLSGKKVVMFFGTPREHKGVEDIVNAVNMINDSSVVFVVVGCSPDGAYENNLKKMGGEKIKLIYKVPADKIPYYLSMSDIIIVPQRQTTDTAGQIPSKLFDAMAMAKPIISTNVSDIPLILDDCGVIIEPGDIHELKDKIMWLLENPGLAESLGKKARERCMEKYSFEVIRESLLIITGDVLDSKNQ